MKYKHGGNIYELNLDSEKIMDFSANINPLCFPKFTENQVFETIYSSLNYPDPNYTKLKNKISSHYKIDSDSIVVGNGGIQLIHNTVEFLDFNNALIIAPTFIEYEKALKRFNKNIEYYLLKEENDFEFNLNEFLKVDLSNIEVIFICNPNNPTGRYIEKDEILKLLEILENKGITLILDESFMDFLEDKLSLITEVKNFKNLIVLRSLTKFYAIPGIRLGFLVTSNTKFIDKINLYRESWVVNSVANEIGQFVLDDHEFICDTRKYIKKERTFLVNELNKLNIFKVYDSTANYIFLKTKNNIDYKSELLKYNILIRNCDNYIGLNNSFYRIAVKRREENEFLIISLKKINNKK